MSRNVNEIYHVGFRITRFHYNVLTIQFFFKSEKNSRWILGGGGDLQSSGPELESGGGVFQFRIRAELSKIGPLSIPNVKGLATGWHHLEALHSHLAHTAQEMVHVEESSVNVPKVN